MSFKKKILNKFAEELGYADWYEAKEDWDLSISKDYERIAKIAEELQEITKGDGKE